ncbi:GATOR complex protein Nprl3 isoform X2 [Rhynchophorus ferrugineus]|uniref:GATOR complex protein NPRL3 n=1 Tax=Rhynchophorus ferrugineus TaxID=354439 RepID=A0A834M5H0_RHYFE|nr:hypothetical protein GWI33_015920 [Rhynchophorus ferrugineus]
MEVSPLCVILVKSDSKGDRLLFRYPFVHYESPETLSKTKRNPYALPTAEDLLQTSVVPISTISKRGLTGFSDEVLSSLFAVKNDLCNRKFELKVNDVRFVSHPTQLQLRNKQTEKDDTGIMLINIVFSLSALASHSVVKCYHDLSKRIGIILRHEEKRCGYISEQTQTMMAAHDDSCTNNNGAAFEVILQKCTLAANIKKLYEDLCSTGLVNIRLNSWIPLSFCLPQKAHQWHLKGKLVEPEDIDRCLLALRPYHSLLLLHPVQHLINFTSLDSSPSLVQMLSQYSPMKNLQKLAKDSDLSLKHVFELTAHLVYWAKATVIFPVCSKNNYTIASDAPISLRSGLIDMYSTFFPGGNLIRALSEFSLPTSLGQITNPLCNPSPEPDLIKSIIWMLQHHLLVQLHTYVQYMPTDNGISSTKCSRQYVKTPPRTSSVLSTSFPEPSRTESESGTSTVSEAQDFPKHFALESITFASTDDDKHNYQEELLHDFPTEESTQIFKIPATNNPEDLKLFARLCRKGYFQGNHHLEEIMYLENLPRSQLLQLLDKFRDVLVTYETEDPAIAMFSSSSYL